MLELATAFQSLPLEYQRVIRQAQDRHRMSVTPLQQLGGGWSGALIFLVSVAPQGAQPVEHFILKLDRKNPKARADEIDRHGLALSQSPPGFARDHLARMAFERIEQDGAVAIFYSIAGQSLRDYRPLSSFEQPSQLEAIFVAANRYLLSEWNAALAFEQAVHPGQLLRTWLSFRLEAGGNVERFLSETCGVPPELPGFLIQGNAFPNPLAYARSPEAWGAARPIDIAVGFHHGDLNTNNVLVSFSKEALDGFYLIDFALFKERMPLLYDLRYLEMSYLALNLSPTAFGKWAALVTQFAEADVIDAQRVPVEMAGVCAVVNAGRTAFDGWIEEAHPSLRDDLWGQYWLAGAAAGLSYCHKAGQPVEERLAGLIYAAANLKRYAAIFGLPAPTELRQLYDESRLGQDARVGAGSPFGRLRRPLPAQPTPFIGRADEIASARAMLLREDVRLVTLTGPGGTGKTRLSLQVAGELIEAFGHGVAFVSLADIGDADRVVSTIAQQLDVREGGSQPLLDNLKDYLRDKHMLLVLDNFEQVAAAAPVVAELLSAAPGLKVLATSRIALKLRGEHEFPVPPLEVPKPDDAPERLGAYESVRLFVEQAQAAHPGFELNQENAPAVAEICRRLDGLPLAIELAAARIRLLPPQAMLARLDDALKLLVGGGQDRPARHQTLRATLDWSYGLLGPDEQVLYARLGVFVGGFGLEAAEAVCNPDGRLDVLEGVAALLTHSLLRREEAGGQPRFRMLETIRAHALEQLAAAGEAAQLRRQHAGHYAQVIIDELDPRLLSQAQARWLDWSEREHDNIRAALTWSQSAPEGLELGPPLVANLNWFWYRRGYFEEGRRWSERVLASPAAQGNTPARAMTLGACALLAMWQGELRIAEERAKSGLAILQRIENEHMMPYTLLTNGVVLINMGRDSEAHPLLNEAQALFREAGLPAFQAVTLVHLGNVALGLGRADEARARLEQAYAIARDVGEEWTLSFALNNLGEVARTQGDYEQARQYYEDSEALLRASGDKGDLARLIHSLGYVAQREGDLARAEAQFRQSLAMFRRLGNKRGIAECLAALAGLTAVQGHAQQGATMLGAAEALLDTSGAAWWPADRAEVDRNRALMRSELGEEAFAAAWEAGRAMPMDRAVALATDEA